MFVFVSFTCSLASNNLVLQDMEGGTSNSYFARTSALLRAAVVGWCLLHNSTCVCIFCFSAAEANLGTSVGLNMASNKSKKKANGAAPQVGERGLVGKKCF